MNFVEALHVIRSGGTIVRGGRSYVANRDERERLFGGVLDVSDPESPEKYKWSDDDRAAEDWIDPSAPVAEPSPIDVEPEPAPEDASALVPEPISPEAVDAALVEQPEVAPTEPPTDLDAPADEGPPKEEQSIAPEDVGDASTVLDPKPDDGTPPHEE